MQCYREISLDDVMLPFHMRGLLSSYVVSDLLGSKVSSSSTQYVQNSQRGLCCEISRLGYEISRRI